MKRSFVIMLIVLCALPLLVAAQDVTPDPLVDLATEPVEPAPPSLESVTGDPAAYYGQEVMLEGVAYELVNVRSFLLGEAAALDDDQVIVLNNSGEEFNIGLTAGARVMVTGTVYPAFSQGGWDQVAQLPMGGMHDMADHTMTDPMMTEEAMTGDMMATEEPMSDSGTVSLEGDMIEGRVPVTLALYPTIVLEQRFPDHTLLVIDSPDDIIFVTEEVTG